MLSADIPGYEKSNKLVPQPDGSKQSRQLHQANSNVGLSASQLFGKTGTFLSLNSDIYSSFNLIDSSGYYTSTPFEIALNQPLFKFNSHKWEQRINKLQFEESEKKFYYDLEDISINSTRMFFNLMVAQIQKEIAELNLQNNDTIYKIARGRYDLGRIAENEYLQIELQFLKSQQELEQANMDIKNYSLELKNYLGIKEDKDLLLLLPDVVPTIEVNESLALEKAKFNRHEMIAYERSLLQAEADMKEAKANSGFNADLKMSYGLSTASNNTQNIYNDYGQSQTLNIHMAVPIVDWGRAKSAKSRARARLELTQYTVEQDMVNFEQEVVTHVNYFMQTRKQVDIAKKSDEIAAKRYEVAKNRYMIGNISITDINIASQEQDQARKNYINSLREYWMAYYQLRKLTMFDFYTRTDIMSTYEEYN